MRELFTPTNGMCEIFTEDSLGSFWAYILSIYYSRSEHWQIRSGLAVGIACFGVLVMTYGDSRKASASLPSLPDTVQNSSFLGDMLGLVSSFACGFYEVRSISTSTCQSKYIYLVMKVRSGTNDTSLCHQRQKV